jgi:superfamily II DNA or RNA helicase
MVNIEFDNDSKQLLLQCSGSRFQEEIEVCKYLRAIFNGPLRKWTISPSRLDEVLDEFQQFGISISEYSKREIKAYLDNLSELKTITTRKDYRSYKPELLLLPPLHDFQKVDIQKAINRNRYSLCWHTGLGKSFGLFAILQYYRHLGIVNKAIILTSGIGVWNLSEEAKKFIPNYDPSKTLVIRSVGDIKDRLVFDNPDYNLIIMGYDTFKLIADAYYTAKTGHKSRKYHKSPLPLDKWFGQYEGIVFFDEFHLLGNPKSLRSKAILQALKFFEYRYAFSATPADKNEKCYSWLKIMDNDLVKGCDYYDWIQQYWSLGNRFSVYGINYDSFKEDKWTILQDRLYKDYAVKREKNLLNLPTAYDMEPLEVEMSEKHRKIYEAFTYHTVSQAQIQNAQNNAGVLLNTMNTFAYLQLAVDNPSCLLDSAGFNDFEPALQNMIKKFNFEKDFNKLKILDDIVTDECDEKDHKIIIFYYHPKTLESLKNHFKSSLYNTVYVVSSDIPKEDRLPVIEQFKKDKDAKILLASVLIANTSFTLTECKAAVYFERTWSYIDFEQSKGRIYRIGQKDEVTYYYLLYKDSMDYLQLKALETKGKVLENLVKKNTLNQDEWKFLFSANSTSDIGKFLEG